MNRLPKLPVVTSTTLPAFAPKLSRRSLGVAAPVASLAAISPSKVAQAAEGPWPAVHLVNYEDLVAGVAKDVTYPNDPHDGFVIRLGRPAMGGVGPAADVVAFLRACPHMGCPIAPINVPLAELGPCVCHRSRFDLLRAGRQTFGRATQSLVQILLTLRGRSVTAVGLSGLAYGEALRGSR